MEDNEALSVLCEGRLTFHSQGLPLSISSGASPSMHACHGGGDLFYSTHTRVTAACSTHGRGAKAWLAVSIRPEGTWDTARLVLVQDQRPVSLRSQLGTSG